MFRKIIFTFGFTFLVLFSFAQDRQFSTHLPLVFIDTDGKPVLDKPKIPARMGIIWNELGGVNHTCDTFNHYNGMIAIEVRGSTSQSFPKKSYGFETRNNANEDMDFPLLGLPAEEDWILYGPYSDKSLIRNALTFTLAQSLGQYSSRFKIAELFLNDEYQGIYLLMEKIKRDSVRVNINKLKPNETGGKDLTGGYIIKIDKATGDGGYGWQSQYLNRNGTKTFYQYEVPAADEIVVEQKEYIQNFMNAFEKAVLTRNYEGAGSYKNYIEVPSFINYFLLSELTKNVDAYRLSTFLHKDKNGKLNAGPVWDYNLAFGNADYYNAWTTTGFQIDTRIDGTQGGNPFWWKSLWGDTAFVNEMRCRWKSLRKESWSSQRIIEITDSLVNALDGAVERNFERWPVLGKDVWPNYYIAPTHSDEIAWMKNWMLNRLDWLDANLPGICAGEPDPDLNDLQVLLYPNPVISEINFKINLVTNLRLQFKLYNLNGTLVNEQQFSFSGGEKEAKFNISELPEGFYIYHLYKNEELFQQGKLVKY